MKVIISDIESSHANNVKLSLMAGYPELLESDIEIRYGGLAADLEYARSVGAVLVVRSTTGAQGSIATAAEYYLTHGILTCMPAGSNTHTLVFISSIPQSLCVTGGGDWDGGNETGYKIEFQGIDPITPEAEPDELDLSSYANGFVAGQLLKIKEATGKSWVRTRWLARRTGGNNNTWDLHNGYGFISVNEAIQYEIDNPETPVGDVGTFGSISYSIANGTPTIVWSFAGNYTIFNIFKRVGNALAWTKIAETQNLTYTDNNFARSIRPTFYKVAASFNGQTIESGILILPLIKVSKIYYKPAV